MKKTTKKSSTTGSSKRAGGPPPLKKKSGQASQKAAFRSAKQLDNIAQGNADASHALLERIQKILANFGHCSRRHAEILIAEGKVLVNEKKAQLGQKADPINDEIKVEGKVVKKLKNHLYLALNKPKEYLSTVEDPTDRKTIMDLLPKEFKKTKPAGRLDYESQGLIILSTDGTLINHVTHPKFLHSKEYEVVVKGKPSRETLKKLTSGTLKLHGYALKPMEYKVADSNERHTKIKLTLTEGRKRQIRKVFEMLGHPIVKLLRTRIGPVELKSLKEGKYRELTLEEISKILSSS